MTRATAYAPAHERRSTVTTISDRPSYPTWLQSRERVRGIGFGHGGPGLSVLTTVYTGTDAALFSATAASVAPQLAGTDEWVVLAHGPITADTEAVLRQLESHRSVRVLSHESNLGIVGGMRVCLESARAEYVLPVDADDLLTSDALEVMRRAVRDRRPALAYSDEDFLSDGRMRGPYARPDYDPVLDLESSWVWHLCAFDRAAALQAGVYTDVGANYCHDWDTLGRLGSTGRPITHVREVLYHWRQHAGSHTNNVTVHPGSSASVAHVLESRRQALANPAHFQLKPFPLFRGRDELYLARVPSDMPGAEYVRVTGRSRPLPVRAGEEASPGCAVAARVESGAQFSRRLRERIERSTAAVMAFCDEGVAPTGAWIDEALRLFALHPNAAVCSGRVVSRAGVVVAACRVLDAGGAFFDEGAGRTEDDPGPFGLAFKPHRVAAACPFLFVADAHWLRTIAAELPPMLEWHDLAAWLSAVAWSRSRSVVYSPLVQGCTRAACHDDEEGAAGRAAIAHLREVLGTTVMGMAGVAALAGAIRPAGEE